MKYEIYTTKLDSFKEYEESRTETDNVSAAMRIAEALTAWIADDSGGTGTVIVKRDGVVVTCVCFIEDEYIIDGDSYTDWRTAEEEVSYRIGQHASDLEMEEMR